MKVIKSFCNWVGHKGLLHALICYSIMLAVYPIYSNPFRGAMWSFLLALLASLTKEVWDLFRNEEANADSAWHDLLCDAMGMAAAVLTWLLWWVCGL